MVKGRGGGLDRGVSEPDYGNVFRRVREQKQKLREIERHRTQKGVRLIFGEKRNRLFSKWDSSNSHRTHQNAKDVKGNKAIKTVDTFGLLGYLYN